MRFDLFPVHLYFSCIIPIESLWCLLVLLHLGRPWTLCLSSIYESANHNFYVLYIFIFGFWCSWLASTYEWQVHLEESSENYLTHLNAFPFLCDLDHLKSWLLGSSWMNAFELIFFLSSLLFKNLALLTLFWCEFYLRLANLYNWK